MTQPNTPGHIAHYRVVGELGRGGMGVVYKAVDSRNGAEVAIKLLLKGRDAASSKVKRFDREARALAKVEHPNVVRLRDMGEHTGFPFLVMDFHSGGSLRDRLQSGPLSPGRVAELGVQIASGVAAAHEQSVLHRDLKPDNVLIGEDGQALVTDFGLAKDLERLGVTQELTQSGTLMGTPGYWAPEQAMGEPGKVGPATDVYGLGAVLYAALTGRPPAEGANLLEIVGATAQPPPSIRSLRPEVPRRLETIVLRCLAQDPKARWESASALQHALERFLACDDDPSPHWTTGLLAGLAGVAIVVLGGLAWVASQRTTDPSPKGPPTLTRSAGAAPDGPAPVDAAAADPPVEPALTDPSVEPAPPDDPSAGDSPPAEPTPPSAESIELFNRGGDALMAGRHVEARRLFREAAEAGHGDAMSNLGYMFRLGRGGPVDEEQGALWCRRAAESGSEEGMYNLGVLLTYGIAVPKDEVLAVSWYRRAADKGHAGAMANLGHMYLNGLGVEQDDRLAFDWYRQGAEGGNALAMARVGYSFGAGRGVERDDTQAVHWYRKAAEAGEAEGMLNLAHMLRDGLGVGVDISLAVEWYRRAASSDDPNVRARAEASLEELGF